jgi:hypothetical protein
MFEFSQDCAIMIKEGLLTTAIPESSNASIKSIDGTE